MYRSELHSEECGRIAVPTVSPTVPDRGRNCAFLRGSGAPHPALWGEGNTSCAEGRSSMAAALIYTPLPADQETLSAALLRHLAAQLPKPQRVEQIGRVR